MTQISDLIIQQATAWRRSFHTHPEIGLQEYKTSQVIQNILKEMGLEVYSRFAGTGLVAILKNGEGPMIGLRADIDALPMQEHNHFSHCSQHEGAMHACGHDGHTAILLGAALHLSQTKSFKGSVCFIFQPAEENAGGARMMLEDGLLDQFPIEEVYALHNWPGLPVGEVVVNDAAMMASQDNFYITLTGAGCHAAMPEKGADPVIAGAQLIIALQTLVSRRLSPLEQTAISLTQVHAGEAINVIPEKLTLSGTLRCLKNSTRKLCWQLIEEYVQSVPATYGVKGAIEWKYGYPVTCNHADAATKLRQAASTVSGIQQVHHQVPASMAAEDFSYFLEARPGAYFWLGADGQQPSASLHNPHYDFNDDLLKLGIGIWVSLIEQLLN